MQKIKLALRYIHYLLTSKDKYSIHSPFIFDFVENVINNKETKTCLSIKKIRKELLKSKDKIRITDFGAGSQINRNKIRKIKDIARHSSKNEKFGRLLYRIAKHYKSKNILELGTSFGISTSYLAKANKESTVYSFEGCPESIKIAKNNFEKLNINNVNIIEGEFERTLIQKIKSINKIDLIFIDGNHQEIATIKYFKTLLKYANNNTIFIFDDINWSKGMMKAWKKIKENPNTTVSINLFFVGIIFIKKELSKEHFNINF